MDRERLVDSLVKKIQSGELRTLGIYGHGGSGKTTFTKALCERLDLAIVNLLETDPYVIGSPRGLVVPKDSPGQKVTACLSSAHELASLERDIQALQAGMDIRTIDQPWSPSHILSGNKSILIVEGMSVAFLPKSLFDQTICFYTDDHTELERRLSRDVAQRNREIDFIYRTHKIRREQYHLYYQPLESEADILVNTSQDQFRIVKE
uniref:uridine kinase family protein n=1 Tax=uncultured Streptococcus sp. TaxID=83427 RepID=UPI0025D2922D|nr:phosphoribulokinase [uncultured Streptococcus sp.]